MIWEKKLQLSSSTGLFSVFFYISVFLGKILVKSTYTSINKCINMQNGGYTENGIDRA